MTPDRLVRVAVIPGDGIGAEVVPVAVGALKTLTASRRDVEFQFEEFPWGSAYHTREGAMMPRDGLETLRGFDVIFLGAVGDVRLVPDDVSLWGLLLRIRREFHQDINLRPARLLEGMPSPLRDPLPFDMLVVRENSEGEYSEIGGAIHDGADEVVVQVSLFSRRATERVVRFAFEAARRRRQRLTSATKSNGIKHTMPFWDRVVREVATDFPDVEVESVHVDALTARMVRSPESLDVVVASNLFGDILTDLAATLMGSIGVAPAANLNPDGTFPSMFEPVHGSAPDIAGLGVANPLGQVWTAVLMLEHLGMDREAACLFDALRELIAEGDVTPDMGGRLTTAEVGQRLVQAIEQRVVRVGVE